MPFKETGPATEYREIDRWADGVGWIAHPEEPMQRASHALAIDGAVWVVDPVDAEGIDDLLADFGEVAGVVVLHDPHTRDAAAIADRHGVPVYVPEWLARLDEEFPVPVEPVASEFADVGLRFEEVVDLPRWREAALYREETDVLVVADAVGTASFVRASDERLGVTPLLRLTPPDRVGRFSPDRVLVGHGEGIHEAAGAAIDAALDGARVRAPSVIAGAFAEYLRS